MIRRPQRGFTLLEVMVGLALLGLALVVLMKSAAGSIFNVEQAHMTGVVTDLARAKMYDIEEILLKDGFTDTSQSNESEECFSDEGWPTVCYTYKVEEPKLPSFEELTQMAQGKAKTDATKALGSAGSAGSALLSQLGSDDLGSAAGGFENSMLGGMLGMFGASSGVDAAAGASMIQSQYSMFQEVLKVSVRKVTLSLTWTVLGSKRDMKVVAFFTDPTAMNKTLLGQASGALEASGGGSGSGSGSSSTPTTRPPSRGGGGGK
jgi:prepilin-type N-terminal cleavage/methylation domain-containing protein